MAIGIGVGGFSSFYLFFLIYVVINIKGLVSWGRGCAAYPGVYSRISYEYNWIRTQVCWMSFDPPAYFQCTENEKDPLSVLPFKENWSAEVPSRAPSEPLEQIPDIFSTPAGQPTSQPALQSLERSPILSSHSPTVLLPASLPLSSQDAATSGTAIEPFCTCARVSMCISWLYMIVSIL